MDQSEAKMLAALLKHPNNNIRILKMDTRKIKPVLHDLQVLHSMLVLASARQIRRIGRRAAIKRLPQDLIRLVAGMCWIERRDGINPQRQRQQEEEDE
ncbi:hypothetical protein BASA81_015174 [Batrachochytrium salamandrivorans]|nr:hypothetical protein BASA81_015174 [Batrachochytrium salamandrivorans]